MSGTTTNYGWTYPTSTDYVKDGATAIQTLATGIDTTSAGANLAGLVLIKSQAVGTAVSSVTVTNAFSATYENYKIIYEGGTGSVVTNLTLKLGTATTFYYGSFIYGSTGNTVAGLGINNAAAYLYAGGADPLYTLMNCDVISPYLSKYTFFNAQGVIYSTLIGASNGSQSTATSFTDFTIAPGSGTLTGGTIYVYGYRKAV